MNLKEALSQIPENVIERYSIQDAIGNITKIPYIAIHDPAFIGVDLTENFHIEMNEETVMIRNARVIVSLWRKVTHMHITVFQPC